MSSPPFVIDFDEISFRFGGTDRSYTRARFIVDGQIVLEQAGDGKRPLQMHDVYWPVWSWKGKVGVLQFDDADIEDGFLAADHVQTRRYERFALVDDFESGVGYGTRSGSPASAPTRPDLEPLAIERGLAMLVGRRAAFSQGAGAHGRSRCAAARSHRPGRPLVPAFDFGGPGTRIELRAGGEVKRSWSGAQTGRLQGVVWGFQGLREAGGAGGRRRGARRRRVGRHRRRRGVRSRRPPTQTEFP